MKEQGMITESMLHHKSDRRIDTFQTLGGNAIVVICPAGQNEGHQRRMMAFFNRSLPGPILSLPWLTLHPFSPSLCVDLLRQHKCTYIIGLRDDYACQT